MKSNDLKKKKKRLIHTAGAYAHTYTNTSTPLKLFVFNGKEKDAKPVGNRSVSALTNTNMRLFLVNLTSFLSLSLSVYRLFVCLRSSFGTLEHCWLSLFHCCIIFIYFFLSSMPSTYNRVQFMCSFVCRVPTRSRARAQTLHSTQFSIIIIYLYLPLSASVFDLVL